MTTAHDGGKVVSPMLRPPLPPGNAPGTHFCSRLSQLQGHSATGRIMSMKNSNDNIANRTRDLPACSAVHIYIYTYIYIHICVCVCVCAIQSGPDSKKSQDFVWRYLKSNSVMLSRQNRTADKPLVKRTISLSLPQADRKTVTGLPVHSWEFFWDSGLLVDPDLWCFNTQ